MLAQGQKRTLQIVKNMIKEVTAGNQTLVGAHYGSNTLAEPIPIATHIDNLTVSNGVFRGVIGFRPVGDAQVKALQIYRDTVEGYGLGEFLDEVTEVPVARTNFMENLVGSDSIISNIQEIPFDVYMVNPKVRVQAITIKGVKHTQITVDEKTLISKPEQEAVYITQTLTMLFMEREYDAQTLLGYWSDTKLTKTEGLKVMQFLANKSLSSLVIGAVQIGDATFSSSMYPLFNDFTMEFRATEDKTPLLFISCDIASVATFESDIKSIHITKKGMYKYELTILTKTIGITVLLG